MRKLMILVTLSLLCSSVAAQQIYQWKDERGRMQFGQLPPADTPYQPLDIRAPAPIGGELRAPTPPPPVDHEAIEAAEQQRREQQAQAALNETYCEQLRRDLTTLQDNPRLRRTNADGEVERIGEDERQRLIQQTQENLGKRC